MNGNRNFALRSGGALAVAAAILLASGSCSRPDPGSFATPEEAVQAVHDLAGSGDQKRTEEIFGPGSVELFRSGDEAQDHSAAARVKALIEEKVAFEDADGGAKVALLGNDAWPFPIPLVSQDKRWKFDTAKGRDELLNRRIGFNELSTLASLHAYVDAQVLYFVQRRDGNRPAFAQKFMSTEGKHDGLYWSVAEGEDPSPLGDLLAEAAIGEHEVGEPYNGYHFKILTGQGKNAPGGERSYLDSNGLMVSGFAAVAWPAKHGASGVMTFVVNQRGMVFQKDLGAQTETAAAAIDRFDPDASWTPTGDTLDYVADEAGEASDDGTAEEPTSGNG